MKPRYITDTLIAKGSKDAGWLFGKPVLIANNNGRANWGKYTSLGQNQKGTGWQAELYGGVQSGNDDWAGCYIPVNEMPLAQFASAYWSWYQTATETMGVNIVLWVHDPTDFDKRAELTQLANIAGLDKAAGQNSHELVLTTDQFYWYGENATGAGLTEGVGNYYGIDDFKADAIFGTWSIYRISFEFGWDASGTFESAFLEEVKLNGLYIPLYPGGNYSKTVMATKTLECEGGYSANDVVSESDGNGEGTDWDFDMGGVGYITKAIIHHPTTALTARFTLFLYSAPPTCELDDNAANTQPAVADVPYLVGVIAFSALRSIGTGGSFAIATPSTPDDIPIQFNANKLYGVVVTEDAVDPGDDTLLTISLTGEMEVN